VILAAGYGGTKLDDTWEYDGSNWTQITPPTRPTPCDRTAGTFFVQTRQFLLFCGLATVSGSDQYVSQSWVYWWD